MPNISMTVPEVQQFVARPVIFDIVRQVCEITKLPKGLPIYIPGDTDSVAQRGSTLTDQNEGTSNTRLPSETNIQIECTEAFDEANVLSTYVTQPEQRPIFLDDDLKVIIKPAYSSNDVVVTFKFISKSRTEADRWRNDIRMRFSMARDVNLHTVTYGYPVPEKFYQILQDIYKLRQAKAGYNDTFDQWFQAHCSTRLTRASNLAGSQSGLVVAETQTRIVGTFDFNFAPEKSQREGNIEMWVTSFTYNFKYDKPIFCNMSFPVMIHNQLVKDEYLTLKPSINLDNKNLSYSMSIGDFHQTEATTRLIAAAAKIRPITIPYFDEFVPHVVMKKTRPFLTVLCSVDEEDPTLVLNIAQLGDQQVDADVLALMQAQEWQYMYKPYQSILYISLYNGTDLIRDTEIFIDSSLNIRTTHPLNLRHTYRVSFAFNTDLGMLPTPALKRLKQYPVAGRKLLMSLGVNSTNLMYIRQRVDLFPLLKGTNVTLDTAAYARYASTLQLTKTVMNNSIIAKRIN